VAAAFALCGAGAVLAQRFARLPAAKGAAPGPVAALRQHGRPRIRAGEILTLIIALSACSFLLLLTARPWASCLLHLGLCLLLAALNRAKERALHEPLVLADARLLPQVITSPGMYLPFLPVKNIACGLAVAGAALTALLRLEIPAPSLRTAPAMPALALAAFAPAAALAAMRRGRLRGLAEFLLARCPVSADADADARNNGALTAALLHPVWAGAANADAMFADWRARPAASRWPAPFEAMLAGIDRLSAEGRAPHLVLVQAESFCDVRETFRERCSAAQQKALRNVLPHWDRLRAAGHTLPTPHNAFGAYTMRTEFAALTGLAGRDLGPWAFNPYLLAARRPLWSLARHLAARGYATLCIHPYRKDFFRRDKVMPHLGFERFLGREDLGESARFGPHVSDQALGRRVLEELAPAARPTYCFAITMEAHGPWQPGRLTEQQIRETLPDLDAGLFSTQMRLYLCHLRHMDELLGMLLDRRSRDGRRVELWAYGDHSPGVRL
jgi:phosphoglycerol transferase MdoB-like AlkP superfamily enzyme